MKFLILLLSLVALPASAKTFNLCFASDNPGEECIFVEAEELKSTVTTKKDGMTVNIDGLNINLECNAEQTECLVVVGATDTSNTTVSETPNDQTTTSSKVDGVCYATSQAIYVGAGKPNCDDDRDGVLNASDRCPSFSGTASNLGCPSLDYGTMVGQINCSTNAKVSCKIDTDFGNDPRETASYLAGGKFHRVSTFIDGSVTSIPHTVKSGSASGKIGVNIVGRPSNGASLRTWYSLTPGGEPLGPLSCYQISDDERNTIEWSQGGTGSCTLNYGGGYYWFNYVSCTSRLDDYDCSGPNRVLPDKPHVIYLYAPENKE